MFIWESIKCWAEAAPLKTSLAPLNYKELKRAVDLCYSELPEVTGRRVGLLVGNRPLWGIYDLALTLKGAVVVPIPTFFSKEQVKHIVDDSAMEMVVVDDYKHVSSSEIGEALLYTRVIPADPRFETPSEYGGNQHPLSDLSDPKGVAKIIYTSGTTGKPKGVIVTLKGMEAVAKSLIGRSGTTMSDRHLSLLPLSTLVEAIGGLYRLLAAGAAVIYPETGFPPENILFKPEGLTKTVKDAAPTTLNLVPSLLEAILKDARSVQDMPSTLRFVACGGAPLAAPLRRRAAELGVPLYEGYGLSECSSVVALNGAGMTKDGSVGRVLPHAGVNISEDGEIIVSGLDVMSGYTSGEGYNLEEIATGDTGYMDDEGYLFITGRKDNLIITVQGRNVSPEWLEAKLLESKAIDQIIVYRNKNGEVSAVIVPSIEWIKNISEETAPYNDHLLKNSMAEELKKASIDLPAYAKVRQFTLSNIPFSAGNGFMGPDGSINRNRVKDVFCADEFAQSNIGGKGCMITA